MEINIVPTPQPRTLASLNQADLGFGRHLADHMFLMNYTPEEGWHNPRIEPYRAFGFEPANLTFHYGQTIFEGLKAFRWQDGSVHLFRPADHIERFARSAQRLCMPPFDEALLFDAFRKLVDLDRNWVPGQRGTALYLRPTLIAADNALGVRPSKNYLLFVVTSPVGSYYAKGMAPTRILVEEKYSRATLGGLGEVKTAANYAASLLAAEEAKAKGFDQVLWLDAKTHSYAEEVGTMNIFFVIDGVLLTPPLGGTILDGITRRTVIELATEWGLPFEERPVSMAEVVAASEKGTLNEVFGSGTAAVITQVSELFYQGRSMVIEEPANSVRGRMYKAITNIHYGDIADTHGWMVDVPKMANGNGNGSAGHTPKDFTEVVPGRASAKL